jgi:hypothetical protein
MSSSHPLIPRARLAILLLGCSMPFAAVLAQSAPPAEQAEQAAQPQSEPDKEAGRRNQRIERIRIEDRGSRIDELRVGGQTQNITVQPKTETPAYQVMPNDERSRREGQSDSSNGDSKRVWWDVFKF